MRSVVALFAFLAFVTAPAFLSLGSAMAAPPPTLKMRELVIQRPGSADTMAIDRRVRIGMPAGWTGELEEDRRAFRLYGPEGEGKILVAAALHPSELNFYLEELKQAHPSAAPSPPEKLDVPGVRTELQERATRFAIDGREVGEMVLIEKRDTIVLIVTVVDPKAWPSLRKVLLKAYATVDIRDAPKQKAPRVRSPRAREPTWTR